MQNEVYFRNIGFMIYNFEHFCYKGWNSIMLVKIEKWEDLDQTVILQTLSDCLSFSRWLVFECLERLQ